MAPLRFALIGCSKIARKHATSLRRLDEAELVAVCDLDGERRMSLGSDFGVPDYADYHQMMASQQVDVVTVLTPSGDHARRVLDLIQYGKHIVVEKPLVLRLDDADALIRASDEAGIKLFEVKQNRCNRPVQALRRALDDGRFGKLVMGTVRVRWCRTQEYYDSAPWRGTWAWDGGVLTNQASHHIDILQWMMGEPESVASMTSRRLAKIEAEVGTQSPRLAHVILGIARPPKRLLPHQTLKRVHAKPNAQNAREERRENDKVSNDLQRGSQVRQPKPIRPGCQEHGDGEAE